MAGSLITPDSTPEETGSLRCLDCRLASRSSFVFTVRDGAIARASLAWYLKEFGPQMWEPFSEWVSSTYPKDAAIMYVDGMHSVFRLSPESIRLWKRHTREYVKKAGR
jgi:hypothetical protein